MTAVAPSPNCGRLASVLTYLLALTGPLGDRQECCPYPWQVSLASDLACAAALTAVGHPKLCLPSSSSRRLTTCGGVPAHAGTTTLYKSFRAIRVWLSITGHKLCRGERAT